MHEFAAALKLSREKGVGAATFRRLLDEYHQPSLAQKAWSAKMLQTCALSQVSHEKSPTEAQIKQTLRLIKAGVLYGWYYSQPGYPELLKNLGEPPPVIFATSPLRPVRYVAVVGTRNMVGDTPEIARLITENFVGQNYAVISGGAAGVDAVAHQTALSVGAYTVAVLGTGLDIVYPPENKELFDRIRSSGALMTELMPGALPLKSFFPTRNRIIAAMADIVVVVQATVKSGSMITASWAGRLGRRLVTVAPPRGSSEEDWAGNQQLIDQGAEIFIP